MGKGTITLQSSDGFYFTVEQPVALQSETVKSMVEELQGDEEGALTIPLPNVHGKPLAAVLSYCKEHVRAREAAGATQGEAAKAELQKRLEEWDKKFITVDQAELYQVTMAANFLNIPPLLDLCVATIADIVKGKTPEEIRSYFHIVNDFTPEEEEEVKRENQWAFE